MQEDMMDTFLRYGLFLGAVFQLICIGAVIIMPDSSEAAPDTTNDSDSDEAQTSDQESPQVSPTRHLRTKREKRKRR